MYFFSACYITFFKPGIVDYAQTIEFLTFLVSELNSESKEF